MTIYDLQEPALEDLCIKDANIRLISTKINYGSGNKNPLNETWFFEKATPSKLIRKNFQESPEYVQ